MKKNKSKSKGGTQKVSMVRWGVDKKDAIGQWIGDGILFCWKKRQEKMKNLNSKALTKSPWYSDVWTRNEQLVEELEI